MKCRRSYWWCQATIRLLIIDSPPFRHRHGWWQHPNRQLIKIKVCLRHRLPHFVMSIRIEKEPFRKKSRQPAILILSLSAVCFFRCRKCVVWSLVSSSYEWISLEEERFERHIFFFRSRRRKWRNRNFSAVLWILSWFRSRFLSNFCA